VHILTIILQAICGLALIILMAVQNDKAEQGGVMGIGGAGGRDAGEIDMEVGIDRILKPLTRWIAGGFLAFSILAAIPADKINIAYILIGVALYVLAMLYGGLLWQTATGMKKG
jgi:preprotein translocase subunit SecG